MKRLIVTTMVAGAVGACIAMAFRSGPVDRDTYRKWFADPDNGLMKQAQFNDLLFRLEYHTPEIIALRGSGDRSVPALQSAIEQFKGAHYFNLRMQALKVSDLLDAHPESGNDYFAKQYYFGSLVQDDLQLVIGGDTLPCAQAHFERTYGAAPFNNLVISFLDDATDPFREDITFIYNDRAFGLGRVVFTLAKEDLRAIPQLKRS